MIDNPERSANISLVGPTLDATKHGETEMSLSHYEKLVKSAELATPSEGLFINAGILRDQIRQALWQPAYKAKAVKLAARLLAVIDRSAAAAGCA